MHEELIKEIENPSVEIPRLNYRAYHPGYREMYEVKALYPQSIKSYIKGHVSLSVPEYMANEYFYNEVFIMQSSGCVDKNNIETFEKDIIEFIDKATGKTIRHIVRNVDQIFENSITIEGALIHFKESYEVLGDVYQDKEILKEECEWIRLGVVL